MALMLRRTKNEESDNNIFWTTMADLLLGLAIIFQYNLFVTPEKLEQTHREILSEISQVYITKSEFGNMKDQIMDINKKVDKIYDTLINERGT